MAVNLFLSSHTWTLPRNEFGVRHHVPLLYQEVFPDRDVRVYPRAGERSSLGTAVRHLPAFLKGELNVIAPGYPIVTGALASWFSTNSALIVHTWKVPGISDDRISARAYDSMLRRVIDRARLVVVANHVQRRQMQALGTACPVVFAPVTVDSRFWHPEPNDMAFHLSKFGLHRDSYVLTVGGSSRDECYGAVLGRELGLPYVRATNDAHIVDDIRLTLIRHGLNANSKVLVHPSDLELRALYASARIVCLPTITRTNPAGLSALVEALSCGAFVGIPESIAEGYVADGSNGMLLSDSPEEFAARVLLGAERSSGIRKAARRFAKEQLHVSSVAAQLRAILLGQSQ